MAEIAGHDGLFRWARDRNVMAAAFIAAKHYREIHDTPPEASVQRNIPCWNLTLRAMRLVANVFRFALFPIPVLGSARTVPQGSKRDR
jgi:hypothetical protein